MNSSLRILMGIAVLFILVPAIALTLPNGLSDLNPWSDGNEQETTSDSVVLAADDDGRSIFERAQSTASQSEEPDSPVSGFDQTEEALPGSTTLDFSTTTEVTEPGDEPAQNGNGTAKPKENTKPSGGGGNTGTTPTTKASSPPTTGASSPVVTGTITGSACPCTVTGTVELKGNIDLKGDLMVMGGTLVARPGVNLKGNGHQIMFMNGAKADFQGTKVSTWSGTGSNANLSRDINFSNLRRIMFHEGAGKSILKYFTVKDSGTGALGDYSIHFHKNGNSTRGTLVEGVVVVGSKNHAFVPHASHGITFRDTIAKNGKCEAYWWDPPEFQSTSQVNNSQDILYDHALADGVTNCSGDDRGFRLSAFELGAGKGNTIKNSVARNVNPSHAKDCAGFHWPELSNKQPSSWTFTNNASYGSKCNGIFVWQNDSETHIINGYKGDGIDHGAYINRYDYRNVDVEFVEIHALGWTITGGHIGTLTAFRHTLEGNPVVITDVDVDKFIVNNASNGGTLASTYVLNNTGLACSDIQYQSVVPGTNVKINGSNC